MARNSISTQVNYAGRAWRNQYTTAAGAEARQFVVDGGTVSCAICQTEPINTPWSRPGADAGLMNALKYHCGQHAGYGIGGSQRAHLAPGRAHSFPMLKLKKDGPLSFDSG